MTDQNTQPGGEGAAETAFPSGDGNKTDIRSMTLPQLKEYLGSIGEKSFRADQVFLWMHQKLVTDFDEMSNLPKSLRDRLKEHCTLCRVSLVEQKISQIDGTRKFLFALEDGNVIESVFMRYHHGDSVCISSQVGCRMGCRFCASTLEGMIRNLTPAEMLGQIYEITRLTGEKISNVVVMGSGEPMDNFDNLIRFMALLSDEKGLHLSQRSLTVSTCGIVPRIRQLADMKPAITLAISLHAATDEKRRELMPVARSFSLAELMDACRYYFDQTGRRLTFEYSLVAGVNDSAGDAGLLAGLLKGMNAHVNLIPVNPVTERNFKSPDRRACEAFQNKLEKMGINATIRREMGRDIDGACGQLRRRYLKDQSVVSCVE